MAGFDDGRFGFFPVFVGADIFAAVIFVAQGYLCIVVVEAECFEYGEDDVHDAQEFVFYLVGAAEDVCVVLREAAHACQSMELAALLVTVYGAEFGDAHGQVFIGAGLAGIDFAVVRAVHGFEHVFFAFVGRVYGLERVFAVFGVVARGDVELFAAYVGCDDLLVAVACLYFLEECFEAQSQVGAFG